jgi:hypothetical protein
VRYFKNNVSNKSTGGIFCFFCLLFPAIMGEYLMLLLIFSSSIAPLEGFIFHSVSKKVLFIICPNQKSFLHLHPIKDYLRMNISQKNISHFSSFNIQNLDVSGYLLEREREREREREMRRRITI